MDDALCGGGDTNAGWSETTVPLSESAVTQVKAAIFMGDPRWVVGLDYEVGTCQASGVFAPLSIVFLSCSNLLALTKSPQFAARESGFSCPNGSVIQSYCDAADPYCCNGSDESTHQGYGSVYGQDALSFIQSQLG